MGLGEVGESQHLISGRWLSWRGAVVGRRQGEKHLRDARGLLL